MTLIQQDEALKLMQNAHRILIAPSSPDGDSIGACLSLKKVLQKLGKEVTVVSTNEVPDYLKFLPFTKEIEPELPVSKDFVISLSTEQAEVDHLKYEVEPGKINIIVTPKKGQFKGHDLSFETGLAKFDLVITVDTGDLVQLGKLYENHKALFEHGTVLNIDHHASNGKFGSHNFLDYSVAATTQLLTPLIQQLETETAQELIDEDVATLLLVGIITDTGSFQHTNTTPEAFEVAAELLERGARQQEIIKHIFKTKSLATLKLWGRVLSKIKYEHDSRIVYSTITQADLSETGAESDDAGGIIDELMSNAPKAEVVLLLKEKEPGFISGSLRAPGKLADVSEIAGQLGGGGHKKAAGFRIRNKSMDEALALAKQTISNYIQAKLSGAAPQEEPAHQDPQRLFPGLTVKPQAQKPQTRLPKVSPGGEDLLLKDFRERQNSPEEQRIKDASTRFFQDADGQEAPSSEPTVGDVLAQMQGDQPSAANTEASKSTLE